MNAVSERINRLAESATLAMTRKSFELKQQGKAVINLSIGEPDFDTPEFIKNAAKKAIDDNFTHYTAVPGIAELREAICEKLQRDNQVTYTPDQIVVCTGAKQALANTLLALVNPGEEVIVPAPYWVSYSEMVKLAEGTAVFINAGIEHDFKITPEQLREAITPATKLIMFNSPCNPTGSVYTREEMKALADVMADFPHVYLLSDEIYEHIIFEGKHESFGQFENIKDRVIIVNGVSKSFAMTGWRLGFLAAPLTIAKACNKIQGQFTSATSSISQKAAIVAFKANPTETPELKEMVVKFRQRRDLLLSLLNTLPGVKTNIPNGAFYLFPDVTAYYGKKYGDKVIHNGDELCLHLLEKTYVALVPGSAFGDENCIRLSYATSEENLIEAINRIRVALAELK
ncbi:MAG: pyridoxal phosphate-dependent aminotransferase [Bacteroidales bacterium]|nr:pyridoxal phosphate-dependent aminotransferase [Bacteroidales bacterium]MDD2322007.1 pyridoxal phosphate-dependent aminotransferase [Bacteroidales bacterium]MDD3960827.1 pyridoxal phosphate-dependent aminotransferase [Bacteroidales bacterium]MDY0284690.1 pyridoxal phosphate-dependent aminotransferase [Bacteroidales bacterium]